MEMILLLLCIGVCVGQTPANSYMSLISSSYLSSDPRLHDPRLRDHRLSDSLQPESRPETIQPNGPTDGVQEHSNRTTQDINGAISTSEIDRNGPSDRQPDYHGALLPQSRLLAAARSQAIPASLFFPGLPSPVLQYSNVPSSPFSVDGAAPYGYVLSHQNLGSPFLRANSRSDIDEVQQNPQYPLSLLAQAPAERRSALIQNQQPNQRFAVDQSIRPSLLNAVPTSRTSLNGYFPIDEPQSRQQSNQNGYSQQQDAEESLNPVNYQFSYGVNAVENGRSVQFAHEEQRVLDQAAGTYSVLLPDGQRQVVEYTADQGGYRPRVSYANDVGQSPSYANAVGQRPSYANAVGQSPSYTNDVGRNPFAEGPSYANDIGQSPSVGNTGLETDDVSGNYGSPVIAARSYQTRGRQRISIDNRHQPQDARTRHY